MTPERKPLAGASDGARERAIARAIAWHVNDDPDEREPPDDPDEREPDRESD